MTVFWTPAPTSGAADDHGFTRSKSALYSQIVLSGVPMGLAQNVRWEGQSGNRPVGGIGEPYKENAPGDFFYTGSMGKYSIRGQDLIEVSQEIYPTTLVVDFRALPFELDLNYQFNSSTGSQIAKTTRRMVGLWIQTWGGDIGDPNALEGENVTFWASGMIYIANGLVIATIGNIPSAYSLSTPPATIPVPFGLAG